VRQCVLSLPIPLRSLFAVHPELLTPALRILHRAIHTHLLKQTGVKRFSLFQLKCANASLLSNPCGDVDKL
jgi:hypothetical protein